MENFHSVFSYGDMPAKKRTFFFSQDHRYITSSTVLVISAHSSQTTHICVSRLQRNPRDDDECSS